METSLIVRSAGFVNPGRKAAKKMREAAAELGFDLSRHRSQLVTPTLLKWAEAVVYMDGGNLRRLKAMKFPGKFPALFCLGHYAKPSVSRIPDPAFMKKGSSEFIGVVRLIADASQRLARELCS